MSEHLSVVMPVYNERYLISEAVRRVLAVKDSRISRLDLIIVDDGSTDGTRDLLRRMAAEHPKRITYVEHERNQGKGAAVVTGIGRATGTVTVIQDADLEYDPQDLPRLMVPFLHDGADAVFGSRFASTECRRVLYYRHTVGNRLLTTVTNILTDLNLTDMETCYKAVRTQLLQSIPIRSHDFRIEPELTFKLAKRGARIFEVAISYSGRTYEEGKKIGFRDFMLAWFAMFRWWLIDDIYPADEHGSNILVDMSTMPRFNRWMADVLRPYVGSRVLEIGAGLGNLTRMILPRDRYTVSDINQYYLDYLQNFCKSKPYMEVKRVDVACEDDVAAFDGQYDTVICLNVIEHVADDDTAVRNIRTALMPGGRAIVLVPQGPHLYGTLDEVLGHHRRYTRASLRTLLERQGFELEELIDFNRLTVPGWWMNGKLLKRRSFSRVQLKLVNMVVGLVRYVDGALPWRGASLIAVARRPVAAPSSESPVTPPARRRPDRVA